jgi:hypothetical protein
MITVITDMGSCFRAQKTWFKEIMNTQVCSRKQQYFLGKLRQCLILFNFQTIALVTVLPYVNITEYQFMSTTLRQNFWSNQYFL